MSVNSKAKSMLVRGIKAEQDLNRIFAKRVLAENEDLQDLLAEHYIEECSPSIGKHLRGVVVYVDPSDSPSYYGVQLDDENNTLVYCRKNGVNIGAFLGKLFWRTIKSMEQPKPSTWRGVLSLQKNIFSGSRRKAAKFRF